MSNIEHSVYNIYYFEWNMFLLDKKLAHLWGQIRCCCRVFCSVHNHKPSSWGHFLDNRLPIFVLPSKSMFHLRIYSKWNGCILFFHKLSKKFKLNFNLNFKNLIIVPYGFALQTALFAWHLFRPHVVSMKITVMCPANIFRILPL